MRREKVDMTGLAEEILAGLQKRDPGRSVKTTVEKDLTAYGDKRLLDIVLTNLFENAWKFSEKRDDAEIVFGLEPTNGKGAFFVRDNGAGFDMSYADKLYGAFQRLHSSDEFEGTGIGLATVQRIINRHGGRVWAEGAVNKGATFHFILADQKEDENEG
jgi:light-regulated signal transduction histidine kinase (bacteriophytochrome)